MGDFNTRVVRDYYSWEGMLVRHIFGKVSDNGLLLVSKWAEYHLCITNVYFRTADKYKTT